MYCEKCGKEIPNESKFCKFCGAKLLEEKKTEPEKTKAENNDLWEKFVEIYGSNAEEKTRKNYLASNEAWELITRLGTNSFENFIKENKEQLDKQPYKVIEELKTTFANSVIGGYWFWMAEEFVKSGNLKKISPVNFDNLSKDWENIISNFFKDNPNRVSNELDNSMNTFHNFQINTILESSPSIKELTNEFIEKLKSSLIFQILWGYSVGIAESKYRK